jgi:hypothetical protein
MVIPTIGDNLKFGTRCRPRATSYQSGLRQPDTDMPFPLLSGCKWPEHEACGLMRSLSGIHDRELRNLDRATHAAQSAVRLSVVDS